MVSDPFMGTGRIVEACEEGPLNPKLAAWDSDGACLTKIIPSLLKIFANQTHHRSPNIVENAKSKTAAFFYI